MANAAEDKEPPLIVVEEQEKDALKAEEAEKVEGLEDADEGADDERLGKGRDVTEEEVAARGNETPEQRRERNRTDKKARKQRRQDAIQRNQTELRYLETRNERLERELTALKRGHVQTQAIAVDGRIAQLQEQIRQADTLEAQAMEANATNDVVEIRRIRDELKGQLDGVKAHRQKLTEAGTQQQQEQQQQEQRQQAGPPPDPRVQRHSREFQDRLEWLDPRARDPDSAVVFAIDIALTREGSYDPRSKEYWKELERRVRVAVPHRFEEDDSSDDLDDEDDEDERPTKKNTKSGGPKMPTGSDRGVKGNNTFYISKERKQALVDAGVWDDAKLRAKYVKKYRDWDQQNAGRR